MINIEKRSTKAKRNQKLFLYNSCTTNFFEKIIIINIGVSSICSG